MSNVNPPFENLSLDPAETIAVKEAYDLACRTLQNIGQLEVDREIVARASRKNRRAGLRSITGSMTGNATKGSICRSSSEDQDGLTVLAPPTLQSQRCR